MKKKKYKPRHEIEAAEPRLLFSAGLEGVLAAQQLDEPAPAGDSTTLEQTMPRPVSDSEASAADEQGLELIFVDSDTPEYRALLDDLLQYPDESSRYEVIVLDNTADGIEQITAALDKYTNLSAVHILSHGGDGAIDLGGSQLDADSLAAKAEQVSSWSSAFSETGDLLIYGCDLAASAEGQMLVNSLATLTGADVAASDDLTGNAAFGADWELEYRTGQIETNVAISTATQESWTNVMAVNVDASSSGSTVDQASVTVSHTTSGTNRLMLVGISMSPSGESVSSVTYNGVNLTHVGSEEIAGGKARVEIWSLLAPDTGTHDVVVNFTNAGHKGASVGVMTFTGVNQTTPTLAFSGDSGLSASASTTVASATDDLVFGVVAVEKGTAVTPGAGQTEYWDINENSINGAGTTEAGAASVTTSWTNDLKEWSAAAVSIQADTNGNAIILDQFNTDGSFAGNDGSQNWSNDWQELGETNGASSGTVQVVSSPDALRIGGGGMITNDGAWREADLSMANSATLTLDVWRSASRSASVTLAISDDGGSNWTNLQTWSFSSLTSTPALQTFDISAYASANTQIRFLGAGEADSAHFYADNIQIEYTVDVTAPALVINTGSSVAEGGTDTITNTELRYDDILQPATSVTYSVTTSPAHGRLEFVSTPGAPITSFTQDDLDNNRVRYVHNGTENFLDSFNFNVDDGQGNTLTGQSFDLTITSVNDAPVLDNSGLMGLSNVLQNSTDPNGDPVSAIIASAGGDRITDADSGAVEGIAVTAVDDANGTWEYSTNGGTSWTAFGAVTNATAVVLTDTAGDLVRFVPNTGYTGNATITFRAWDTSDGNVTGTAAVDTGTGGGITAFSSATEMASVFVEPAEIKLWLSTAKDVGPAYGSPASGVPGLESWSESTIIGMGDPNLSFGASTTDGTFTGVANFDLYAVDGKSEISGVHYITSDITVTGAGIAGGSIDLLAGDMLFITTGSESLTNAATGAPAGWANNIATSPGGIYALRAENTGDYSSGYFRHVMNAPGLNLTNAVTLVESTTTIGDTVVEAGDFLFAQTGNLQKNDIYWYDTSADTAILLIEGDDINIDGGGTGETVMAIELVEQSATVGGVSLSAGNILLSVDKAGSIVGDNNLLVQDNDVFVLNITATTLGSGTAAATATLLFDGDGSVNFDSNDERLDALSLIIRGSGANQPPVLGTTAGAAAYAENGTPAIVDGTITVTDADSADFDTGILSVSISAGGSTGDRLSIFNQGTGPGEIGVSGNDVTYGGVIIGTFTGGLNSTNPLVVNLNANADAAATQALLRNISFWNTTDNPSTLARTVDFVLNDGDGGNGNVISQTVNVSAVADAPVAVDDHWGLDFDGTDDYVSIADSASLTMTNTVTMEAWIKADPSTNVNRMIINKEGEYEVGLFSDGTINWAFANTDPGWAWHNTGYVVPDGVWTHIAVAYDNGTVSTYVNGTLVDTYNGSGPIGDAHATLDELRIGGRSNSPAGKYFDGQIDEVRIWNTARTQLEIEANMDANLTGGEVGLAGYWSFFEGTGTGITDLTGNGNNGTLVDGGLGAAGPQWTGYSTDQDTQINIAAANGILSNDIDNDGDALTVTEVNGSVANVGSMFTLPSGAQLTVGTLGAFIYNPNGAFDYLDAGETGTDTFTYTVDDGNGGTDTATATITITGIADAPTTNNVSATGNEDATSIAITLTGGDVDGTVDYYILNGLPANGTLYTDSGLTTLAATATDYAATIEALTLYFVPNANWNGSTNFQFTAKDNNGAVDATPGTATITVNAVNDAPTTNNVSASGNEDDASIAITLTGGDIDGTVDNYVLNGLPANGNLYTDAGLTTLAATATDYAATAEALTLYFVPNANWNGSTNFQFVAKDNNGEVDATPGTATITVNAINDAPVATASTVITNEDTAHTFVTGDFSYTDVEGDALVSVTFNNLNLAGGTLEHSGGTAVTNGMTLTAAQIATLVYTPASDANGAPLATFDFTVNDADAGVTAAQMDIDVTPVNDAPTTNNVSASGNEDATSIAITLTGGDIDGTVDNYVLNGLPANGTLYIDAGLTTVAVTATDYAATAEALTLYFVPNANWNGSSNFQFVAKDNNGVVDATPGTATLTVNAVNDAPTTNNVSASGNEDDVSIAITLTGGDIDGTVDNYVLNGLPANGTLYLDAGLTTVATTATDYAATAEALTLYFVPNANWNGSTNFQFVAKDNNGLVDATPGTATLTVNAINDAPVATASTVTTNEDTAHTFVTGDFSYTDVEGDALVSVTFNNLNLAGGTLEHSGGTAVTNGMTLTAAQIASLVYTPASDVNGAPRATFDFTVNDADTGVTAAQMDIDVTPVNDAPTSNNVSASGNEDDASIAITLTGGDIDGTVDNYVLNGLPVNGTLYLDAGLTTAVTTATDYAATAEALTLYFVPNANWNGSTNFQFVAKDNNGLVDATPGTATLTVNAVNDAPTTNNVSASGNEDDASIAITLTGGDIDGTVDNYVLNGLPANGTLYIDAGLTTVASTATDYAASGETLTLYFVPNANWNGSTNFQFVAKDNNGLVDATPGMATLTVNAVNDTPTTNNVSASGNEDDASIAITLTGGDIDGTVDNYVLNGLPANGTLYLDAGLITAVTTATDYAATAEALTLYFVPNANWNGSTNFQFVAKDNNGAIDATPGTATITVNSVNDAPTSNNVSASGNEDDASIAITLTGGDIDGTVDNYVLNGLPANGTLYLDAGLTTVVTTATDYAATAEALTLYFVPNANWNGSTNFQFVAKDNNGAVDATPGTATLTVNAVNDAPVATTSTVITNEDTAHTFVTGDFSYTDVEGDALVSVTFNNLNLAGGTLEHSGGTAVTNGMTLTAAQIATLVYTPATDANGAPLATFDFTVNDADAGVTAAQMDIDVTPVNDAPTTNNVSAIGNEDATSIAITLTGGDIDGTVDNYVLNGLPANGTLYLDAGLTTAVATATDYAATAEVLTLYFVPNANWNGSTNFQFVAKDNAGLADATPSTATLTVNAVNDAPVATASTVITNEDTAHTFVTGDFSYTDVEGDALVSVAFNNLNLAGGTLEHSGGTAVTNGMTLTAAQIASLVYTPASDANGAPLATFDYTVNDADAGVTAAQMDIDVTPINDAPTTNNVSASGNEDDVSIAITLTGGDIDGTVDNYVLNGLPANGTLYLDAGLTTAVATATDYAATAEALTLYFVPNANWNGSTNFQFVAKDNNGVVDATPGTATLTVNAVNDAPTTNNVSASGNEDDASIAITLTGGDIDGTVDNYVLNGLPANGTLYLDAGLTTAVAAATDYAATAEALTLYFVPNANWNGSTNFQFVAKDNNGAVDVTPGTATLTVNAVNDAPTTNNVSASGNEDATSIAITLTGGDIDGTVDNYVLNGLPANGTLYVDAGLTTAVATATDYAATAEALTLYFVPNADWNGVTNFQFVAKDNSGAVDATPGTATLTVNAVNDAPTASNLNAAETYTEDTALDLTDIVVSDVDSANVTVTLTLSDVGAGSLSTATSGAVTSTFVGGVWTASGAVSDVNILLAGVTFMPALDYNSNFTIATSVNDGVAAAVTGVKTMTGVAVNDAPAMVFPGTVQTVNEDTPLVFSAANGNLIAVGDVDANGGDMLIDFISYNGTLTLNGTAGLTFTLGDGTADTSMRFTGSIAAINAAVDGLVFTPDAEFNGGTNFQMWVNDQGNTGSGGSKLDTRAALISVTPVNDAPVASDNTVSTTEDTAYNFTVSDFTYSDVEGDALVSVTFNNLNLAGGTLEHSGGTPVINGMTLTAAQIGSLVYTPALNANGAPLATFDFTVNDADAGVTAAQMDIDVTPVNDAPTTNNVSASGNEDDVSIAITLTGGDIDGTVDNYVLNGLPANGTLYLDAGLTTAVATATDYAATTEALTLYFVPNANWNGSTNFQFVAKDNNGVVDATPGTATLTVNAVNDAPVATASTVITNEDTAHTFVTGDFSYTDVEGDALISVTFDNLNLAGGTLEHSGGTAVTNGMTLTAAQIATLVYTPASDAFGAPLATFDFTVNDADAGVTAAQMDIDVTPVNDAPTTNNVSASGNEDDASIAITLTGGDIDGTVDNYVLNGLPANGTLYLDAGLTIVAATATDYAATAEALTLYFVPNANWNGSTNFQFVAKDNNGLVDATPGTATLTVNAVNDAPTTNDISASGNEDDASIAITLTGGDIDGTVDNYVLNGLPANGTLYLDAGLTTAVATATDYAATAEALTLYFVPNANWNGSTNFQFVAKDNNSLIDATPGTATLTVNAVNDAPTTNDVSASGNEDDTSIAISLTGGDIDGTVDNYVLNGLPANGTLYLDTGLTTAVATATDYAATAEALTLYFVPNANWNGSTNFQFVAKDNNGLVDATPGTATLTVNAVNDAPVATASTVITNEDTTHTFVTGDFSYTDVEGDALVSVTFNNLNLAGGTLEHSGGTAVTNGMTLTAAQIASLVYTPATDANGAPQATFDFTVNDADAGVTAAQMDIDVTPVNDAPTTNNVSASGNEDATSIAITLTGGDIDGTVDNYVLNGLPANGTLYLDAGLTTAVTTATDYAATAEALTLYFVPNANWNGSTNFQFVAKDNNGLVDATPGTATLTVNAVNDAPVATASTVTTNEDTAHTFVTGDFSYTDVEGDALVSVTFNNLNLAGGTLEHSGGTAVTNGMTLTAAQIATLVFTPANDAFGAPQATFDFTVNDADAGVTAAQMDIDVTPVNDAPTTNNVSASGNEDATSIAITLTGGDIDGTVDNYVLNGLPANGILYIDAGLTTVAVTATDYAATAEALTLYFVPNANWNGSTNFQFVAKDNNGAVDATPGTATLTVNAVNDAPTTNNVSASGNEDDASIAITLTGGDIDGTVDNYVLNGLPANGTLYLDAVLTTVATTATDYAATAEALTLYFVPNANWNGSTNFQFVAKDNNGLIDATSGTATITVNVVNDAPTTNNVSASGNEDDASIAITLTGGDIDGSVDNYVLNGLPANGTLYLDAGLTTAVTTATDYAATAETLILYFVPNANWNGSTNFQFTAKDNNGLVDATPGTATLTVNAVNDVPTTNDVSASGNEDDASIAITLTGGDIDGTVDNYVLNGLPANGMLYLDAGLATAVTAATDYAATADALTLYFVPNANWNGSTNFQFTAKDNNGAIDATPGTATITVNAVNDAPTGVVTIDYQNPLAGDTITASNTLADADGLSGPISYQWMRNGTAIAGETASTYTTTAADVGTAITVVASYVDDQGTAESVSSSSTSLIEAVSSVEEIPIFPDDPVIDDVEDTDPVIDPKDSDTVAGAAFTPGFQEPGVGEEADVRLMYDVNRYYFKDYDYRDGDVERRMSDHVIKIFDKGADLVMDLSQLVDLVRMQMSETEQGTVNMIFRTVGGITLSLSAGVVTWLTRGGAIAATMVSSVPVLKGFDPIAIMKTRKDKKSDYDNADGIDDSIDSMFEGLDDEQSKITDDQQEIR